MYVEEEENKYFFRNGERFYIEEGKVVSDDHPSLSGKELILTDLPHTDHADVISFDSDDLFIGIEHLICKAGEKNDTEDTIFCNPEIPTNGE